MIKITGDQIVIPNGVRDLLFFVIATDVLAHHKSCHPEERATRDPYRHHNIHVLRGFCFSQRPPL
jgi:hypothetical protein